LKLFSLAIAASLLLVSAALATDGQRSPIVIAFTSKTCAACQHDKPTLDRLNERFTIQTIDVDEQPELARRFHVRNLPTYVVLQDGVEVHRTGDVSTLSAILIGLLFWMFC